MPSPPRISLPPVCFPNSIPLRKPSSNPNYLRHWRSLRVCTPNNYISVSLFLLSENHLSPWNLNCLFSEIPLYTSVSSFKFAVILNYPSFGQISWLHGLIFSLQPVILIRPYENPYHPCHYLTFSQPSKWQHLPHAHLERARSYAASRCCDVKCLQV